jgi:hypothetical protein
MTTNDPRRAASSGYVLLEALFAVLLLSFGLVPIVQATQESLRALQRRRHYLAPARELANNVLVAMALGAEPGEAANMIGISFEPDKLQYEVSTSAWPEVAGLRQVRVTVRWNDRGKAGAFSLVTLLSTQEARAQSEVNEGSMPNRAPSGNALPASETAQDFDRPEQP